ncbi:hypothetical protein TRAPUB_5230 [Trametes pubescens]|uniref:NADH dehydrogenase [ubiquinone] 1 beta subcomplex subunit 4 n=1 Tax=Trametes pubescens TaxID=154538 RepID=A0A1M2V8Y0_TRAPU|nr:hypothetical protein TRAPUB_5230 [Trametes pubescens]
MGRVHEGSMTDPAVERWNTMREAVYKNFRFNTRTARQSILGMLVFPAAIFTIAYSQDVKWDWVGKRKGESLARVAPAPEASD